MIPSMLLVTRRRVRRGQRMACALQPGFMRAAGQSHARGIRMQNAAFRTGLLVGLLGALGVLCTTLPCRVAHAQESGLSEAKEKAKASPASADAALAYGRALRR